LLKHTYVHGCFQSSDTLAECGLSEEASSGKASHNKIYKIHHKIPKWSGYGTDLTTSARGLENVLEYKLWKCSAFYSCSLNSNEVWFLSYDELLGSATGMDT
jgi:hypothetical protein